MFGKKKKRLDRKMRRRIRRTSAVMLLISAIVVAAIPVPDAAAADGDIMAFAGTVEETYQDTDHVKFSGPSIIPEILETDTIYTSANNGFQYVYKQINGDYMAILLRGSADNIQNGRVAIPSQLEAYVQYTLSQGGRGGYAAANQNGDVLFYKEITEVTYTRTATVAKGDSPDWTKANADGSEVQGTTLIEQKDTALTSPTYTESLTSTSSDGTTDTWTQTLKYYRFQMKPCYEREDAWKSTGNLKYYYRTGTDATSGVLENYLYYDLPTGFSEATSNIIILTGGDANRHPNSDQNTYYTEANDDNSWLNSVGVGAISSRRVEPDTDSNATQSWKLRPADAYLTEKFIATSASIEEMSLPDSLRAIDTYSFYDCASLKSVTFTGNSQLQEIGPSAFEDCRSMVNFTFPGNATVKVLPENVFKNCQSLESFTLPIYIAEIGDEAFKDCRSLKNIQFASPSGLTKVGLNVFENCSSMTEIVLPSSMNTIGYNTFKNCSSLRFVTLPDNPSLKPMRYSTFEGCRALEWIDVLGYGSTFEDTDYKYNVESFKADVRKNEEDTFYFIGEDSGCAIHAVTAAHEIAFQYRVSKNFEKIVHDQTDDKIRYTYLVSPDGKLLDIDIAGGTPETVIIEAKIGPYPITSIGSEFSDDGRGNQDLKSVTIPNTITVIGDNAFKGCNNLREVIFLEPNNIQTIGLDAFKTQEGAGATVTELTFYGDIDLESIPFQYAMQWDSNYNNANQDRSYIDFCSGDGTNIHVRYNPGKIEGSNPDYSHGKREVWKVPTIDVAKIASTASNKDNDDYYKSLKKAMLESGYAEADVDSNMETLVEEYDENGEITSSKPSEDVMRILRTAFNIELPPGIQSIRSGLFSEAERENTEETKVDAGNNSITVPAVKDSITGNFKANTSVRNIIMDDVEELEPYTFYGCKNLESVTMYSSEKEDGENIGDYAFGHCPELTGVYLPGSTAGIGKRPFASVTKLTGIGFVGETAASGGNPAQNRGDNYLCEYGIIYQLENGTKDSIVQCLEARGAFENGIGSSDIEAKELAGINSIAEEAFMNCDNLELIDLTDSNVTNIPEFCFSDSDHLWNVSLPPTCTRVDDFAFKDTLLRRLRVPNMYTIFTNFAFYDSDEAGNVKHDVEVRTMKGSTAEERAKIYSKYGWRVSDAYINMICVTVFQDENGNVIAERRVEEGEAVEEPTEEEWAAYFEKYPEFKDMIFTRWSPANYTPASKEENYVTAIFSDEVTYYHVRFVNDNLSVLMEEDVMSGKRTPIPQTPTSAQNPGASFRGWLSDPQGQSPYDPITCDVTFMASYSSGGGNNGDQSGNDPSNPGGNPNDPNKPGDGNNGNNNNNNNNNGNNDNNDNNNSNKAKYTLTVVNGSGSGTYEEGTTVVIAANSANTGYEFYNWTSSESDTNFASKTMAATSFTMPKKNLTVTANYRVKSETGNSITSRRTPGTITSSPASNTGSVNKTNTSSNSSNTGGNSGSSVQVSRPGISDTNIASATVNGSTDNFVVKVTEDGQATMAVAEALRNEYGSLENVHYFAMDISLYDATGTKKITDTNGLSVTVTLPLPDELRQYGGNNKVGAVTGGNNLEKLNARFTTVNGVPCVTFTATHFSPYTIYVDTANLSEGAYDITPKTGDAIHPKWFLAIGLAMFSAVLFLKKDKKTNPGIA